MKHIINLKCWEITDCQDVDCIARQEPEKPCWEIAKQIHDGYDPFEICKECVVYLLKLETGTLTRLELENIIKTRRILLKHPTK